MAYTLYCFNRTESIYIQIDNVESIANETITDIQILKNYRDTGWITGTSLAVSQSPDDGVAGMSGDEARIPDELMHVAPRNEAFDLTIRKYTCTGSKVFAIPYRDWGGDYASVPVRV